MTIAFYKVDNSLDYGRHEFDNICDQPKEIFKKLSMLKEDEWRTYNMSENDGHKMYADAADFETDYNDELLDGGWWCVVIC